MRKTYAVPKHDEEEMSDDGSDDEDVRDEHDVQEADDYDKLYAVGYEVSLLNNKRQWKQAVTNAEKVVRGLYLLRSPSRWEHPVEERERKL